MFGRKTTKYSFDSAATDSMTSSFNNKYELTDETIEHGEKILYRIRALKDIPGKTVRKGDLGGFVESTDNLSHCGDAWISGDAMAYGNAWVGEDAEVADHASVRDNAWVGGKAWVGGGAGVWENARVGDDAWVEDAFVFCAARIGGYTRLIGDTSVGNVRLEGDEELIDEVVSSHSHPPAP